MSNRNLTLLTDLYELTMMQGYFRCEGRQRNRYFRRILTAPIRTATDIPSAAGLDQVIDYINNLHFDEEDIDYLRSTGTVSRKISSNI